jgi:hypothetical protein
MEVSSVALFSYLLDDLYGDDQSSKDFVLQSDVADYWPGASARDICRLRLVRSFYKKLVDETAADADDKCLEKFLKSNLLCKNWQLKCGSSLDEVLVGEFQKQIDQFFYPDGEPLVQSYFDILNHGRCGPGASLGANGEDFYTKLFSSRLTATSPEMYKLYIEYANWFTDWRDAELTRLISFGTPRYTSSSSLTFVRKTSRISRSICTEPSLNMIFQLGLGRIMEMRLAQYFGIDLARQPQMNVDLACIGSRTESVSTIDLEGASDSLSLSMCERFLPEYLLDILHMIRTPKTKIRGSEVTLEMMSTMGNGFTFPLQTILFSCAVRAAASSLSIDLGRADSDSALWGVFGDDIICPSLVTRRLYRLLDLLGFRVNYTKSYDLGPFRESCGADFYQGVNVRGVYIKSLLTQQSRYVAINLLNDWSARTGIYLPRTVGYLYDSVRELAIPRWESMDAGIRLSHDLLPGPLWHAQKQRYLYRCYVPVRAYLEVRESDIHRPRIRGKRISGRIFNPSGLEMAFKGGYIRNSKIDLALKQGESPSYRTIIRVAPYWDAMYDQASFAGYLDFWRRWKVALHENLSHVARV